MSVTGPIVGGLDVGGTKILGRAVDAHQPRVSLAEARVETPRGESQVLDAIGQVVAQLQSAPAVRDRGGVAAVGVGVPGLVDHRGVLRFAPNLPGVVEVAVAPELEHRLGVPVVVDNDANCAAWCESRLGAAVGVSDAVLVTLGTGIGAGIIAGGRLYEGASGFAGEPGHMVIDPSGPPCPCGRRGCWERFASGSGLGRLARDAAAAGRAPAVVARAGGDPEAVRGEHVTEAALAGDSDALAILRELAWWLALGLANLVDLLDCELIVIGGGLAEAGESLLGPVREAFADLVLAADHRPPVRIVAASFGAEAGAIGAALLASERLA